MFIFAVEQMKEQWKKYLLLCVLGVCVLATLLIVWHINGTKMPESATCDEVGEYSLSVKNETEEMCFIARFGLTVQENTLVSDEVTIPVNFNDTYTQYNELQKKIGLDLSNYKGVLAKRHIYKLKNYESNGNEYFITLLIHDGYVIGGHIGTKVYLDDYSPLA